MKRTLAIALLILGFAVAARAQDSDEFVPLRTVTIEKQVNLRSGPAKNPRARQSIGAGN